MLRRGWLALLIALWGCSSPSRSPEATLQQYASAISSRDEARAKTLLSNQTPKMLEGLGERLRTYGGLPVVSTDVDPESFVDVRSGRVTYEADEPVVEHVTLVACSDGWCAAVPAHDPSPHPFLGPGLKPGTSSAPG